ncbi:MAG: hypothetical protein DA330_08555 [Nitrososphaera sp.]|nr:hypothetical protein [Nitrososphaera sp.]
MAKFMQVGAIRWIKWPSIPAPDSEEFLSFENDNITKADKALHQMLKSPEFQQKIATSNSVLDRYRKRMRSKK